MGIKKFLKELNIRYTDYNQFEEAFTHPSFANEKRKTYKDYERLEFLGDAVLQFHVSRYIFKLYPDLPEGELTKLRSKLVREESLARFARELQIGPLIRLGSGEEKNGGRDRDSVLADIFEAFMGVVCLQCGHGKVEALLAKTIYAHVDDLDHDEIKDFKTKLQEMIQADQRKTVTYELLSASGPSNSPLFKVAVVLDGMQLGIGEGKSKKRAEQNAAQDALAKLAVSDYQEEREFQNDRKNK